RPEYSGGFTGQMDKIGGGWAADFYYRGQQRTHSDLDRDGFTDLTRRISNGGGATLFRRFRNDRARLTAGASAITDFRRGGDLIDLPPHETNITEQIHSTRSAGFARWNHSVSPAFYYNLSTSLSHLKRSSYYGAGFDRNAYGSTSNPLSTSDVSAGYQAGRHTITAGFQQWFEHIEDVYTGYGRDTRQSFRNSGMYLQDEWRITSRVALMGGIRGDKSNLLSNWIFSPRGNVRVGLTSSLNLRAGVSTGFRPPQVFDEDLHIAAVGGEAMLIRYAQGLREESSRSLSAALDYTARLGGGPLQLGASFFWTRLDDVFQLVEVRGGEGDRILERTNGPGSRFRGVEFNGRWRASARLAFRGGGTFQLARYDVPEPIFGSLRYFRTPNRYGYAGIDLSLPREVELLNSFEFTGAMIVPHFAGSIPEDRLESSRAFQVWNIILSRTWHLGAAEERQLRLYVRGNNVLNSFQNRFDQGPARDSTYIYGPLSPRGLTGGLTVQF
ncbi:MAG: TonB-dependent receptor, partial [Bryobacteraceae bacterium]|nr:TonB-dependent receptor [Bryobacteraceae bacterium]